jgi:hypothetical protein
MFGNDAVRFLNAHLSTWRNCVARDAMLAREHAVIRKLIEMNRPANAGQNSDSTRSRLPSQLANGARRQPDEKRIPSRLPAPALASRAL